MNCEVDCAIPSNTASANTLANNTVELFDRPVNSPSANCSPVAITLPELFEVPSNTASALRSAKPRAIELIEPSILADETNSASIDVIEEEIPLIFP